MHKVPYDILIVKYNWLSISKGPQFWVQPTVNWKYFTKCYTVSDMDHVVIPKMVSGVEEMYRLIFLVIIQLIKYNNYSHSIYIVLGIVSNLEVI